jgi:hypothetical protein
MVTKIRIPRSVLLHYMTINRSDKGTVLESPDHGKTIYSRQSGSSDRTLIQEDPLTKVTQRWFTWKDILKLSETEPSLRDLVEKAETVYALLKEENN